jgi:hypothetical protein
MTGMVEDTPFDSEQVKRAIQRLYGCLDELRRGDLELGPSDYARVERVLILLAARGIRPEDPKVAPWLAPILCGSAAEQEIFYDHFNQIVTPHLLHAKTETEHFERSTIENEVEKTPKRGLIISRVFIGAVITILIYFVLYCTIQYASPIRVITNVIPQPSIVTGYVARPLMFIPLFGMLGLLFWRRSRRLKLVRAFAPTPEKSEKVVFAAAQPRYYGEPSLRRGLAALRRHWGIPGGRLDVHRSIKATLHAGGRPELRFGTRPHTPEYVLLVDREGTRDHVAAAASLLAHQLIKEKIVLIRYDYFGDPRRAARIGDGYDGSRHFRLADLAAMHTNSTVLIVAEAGTFFDDRRQFYRWVDDLRNWGKFVLLTPRPVEHWDWAEQELEREGMLVLPATIAGLETLCDRVKLGPSIPFSISEGTQETGYFPL